MSLLRAEFRKLARPLVWAAGLTVTGFCLLITWGAANNARDGMASPRIPGICDHAVTVQCRHVIGQAHAAANAAAAATSTLAQPGEIGHVAAGMLASLPGLVLIALVAGAHWGGEWGLRTIRQLLGRQGRRGLVLVAKWLTITSAGIATMLTCWAVLALAGPLLEQVQRRRPAPRAGRRPGRGRQHHRDRGPACPLAVRGGCDRMSRTPPRQRPRSRDPAGQPGTYRQGMSRALVRHLTPVATDRLIAAGLALWALFDVPWWWRPPGHGGSVLEIAGFVALAAAQSVPFGWRRRLPPVVLGVTAAALAVKFALHLNLWSASAAVLTAAYGLGAYGNKTLRTAVRVLVALAVLAAIITLQAIEGNHTTAIGCALFATALAVGEITAAHRDLVASQTRQAYDEERASLAREVHDVVGHQLSAIAVQAGAARLAAAGDPQAAVTAVATIEQGAREGLDELNALVRRLRQTETASKAGPKAAGPQAPRPRLHDVPALVERARQAGLRAELTVDGEARLRDRAHAVVYGYETGLVRPGDSGRPDPQACPAAKAPVIACTHAIVWP